jgi:transposase
MRTGSSKIPAYNVQTAVDAEHAVIVAQQVTDEATDNRSLLPMAEAAHQAVGAPAWLNIVADAGYSNGEQAARCEAQGIVPHVPANRSINSQGDGTLFDRTAFHYDEKTDTFLCPANQRLTRKQVRSRKKSVLYAASAEVCGVCPLKARCTNTSRRLVQRHLHDDTLNRMGQRATPDVMRLRRSTVEHPFATLKYRIFGYPRFLLRGIKAVSWLVYPVAAVAEPSDSIVGGDGSKSLGDGRFQGVQPPGFGGAQDFFDLGPSLLDRVEVG